LTVCPDTSCVRKKCRVRLRERGAVKETTLLQCGTWLGGAVSLCAHNRLDRFEEHASVGVRGRRWPRHRSCRRQAGSGRARCPRCFQCWVCLSRPRWSGPSVTETLKVVFLTGARGVALGAELAPRLDRARVFIPVLIIELICEGSN
jgi:hypothetical protein